MISLKLYEGLRQEQSMLLFKVIWRSKNNGSTKKKMSGIAHSDKYG